jgi:hypothetical protein
MGMASRSGFHAGHAHRLHRFIYAEPAGAHDVLEDRARAELRILQDDAELLPHRAHIEAA